jgi:photosystem II stability/assembly factor-like uncharacterized protein
MHKIANIFIFCLIKITFSYCQIFQVEGNPSFRAVQMLDSQEIWVSGSKGSIYHSIDGGNTWENKCPAIYKNLDFRGLFAIDKNTVLAMSAGLAEEGKAVVIKSIDKGETWNEVYKDSKKGVFLDAIKFKTKKIGYILGDPIDNKPFLLKTIDGGNTWNRVAANLLPDILVGEASFAASNSSIATSKRNVWFCTQNRVFVLSGKSKKWKVMDTPFENGSTLGIFGIKFWDDNNGIAIGGDYQDSTYAALQVAFTNSSAKSWKTNNLAYSKGLSEGADKIKKGKIIIVGLQGIKTTLDTGNTYQKINDTPFHAISCFENTCISVGGNGKIGKWNF